MNEKNEEEEHAGGDVADADSARGGIVRLVHTINVFFFVIVDAAR